MQILQKLCIWPPIRPAAKGTLLSRREKGAKGWGWGVNLLKKGKIVVNVYIRGKFICQNAECSYKILCNIL